MARVVAQLVAARRGGLAGEYPWVRPVRDAEADGRAPYQGSYAFNLHASQTVCSLLGELDSGAYWWLGPNAQLFFGWRVIGVSNVALADNQFPQYVADTKGWETVKPNGDLILTGGFGGVAFAF